MWFGYIEGDGDKKLRKTSEPKTGKWQQADINCNPNFMI
jgi:hypothetical protein